jgi:hypothetical protein
LHELRRTRTAEDGDRVTERIVSLELTIQLAELPKPSARDDLRSGGARLPTVQDLRQGIG